MALSMDEQRILDEMERRLADEDPKLASRLAGLGRPRIGAALQSPRARILATLVALALIVAVSLMVYALMPFRPMQAPRPHATSTTTPRIVQGKPRAGQGTAKQGP
jgi:Protein of unknown function (DUF3040)